MTSAARMKVPQDELASQATRQVDIGATLEDKKEDIDEENERENGATKLTDETNLVEGHARKDRDQLSELSSVRSEKVQTCINKFGTANVTPVASTKRPLTDPNSTTKSAKQSRPLPLEANSTPIEFHPRPPAKSIQSPRLPLPTVVSEEDVRIWKDIKGGEALFIHLKKTSRIIKYEENGLWFVCDCGKSRIVSSKKRAFGKKELAKQEAKGNKSKDRFVGFDIQSWNQHWDKCPRNKIDNSSKKESKDQSTMSLISYGFKAAPTPPLPHQPAVIQIPLLIACTGIQTPETELYLSEHLLASQRGGLNPISERPKLIRTLFEWKRKSELFETYYSAEGLLKLSAYVVVPSDVPANLRSEPGEDLSAAEQYVVDAYDQAKRLWINSNGIIFSTSCSTSALPPFTLCIACTSLSKSPNFQRQMRNSKAKLKMTEEEAADARARHIKYTSNALYKELNAGK